MTSPWEDAVDSVKVEQLRTALEKNQGNVTKASAELGIPRSNMNRYLNTFELVAYASELRIAAKGSARGTPVRVKTRSSTRTRNRDRA